MPAVNISFEVPTTTTVSVEDFRQRVAEYGNRLLRALTMSCTPFMARNSVRTRELTPLMQDILNLAEPMRGTVSEEDINGDVARREANEGRYGKS